jgi:hypothetical protein
MGLGAREGGVLVGLGEGNELENSFYSFLAILSKPGRTVPS